MEHSFAQRDQRRIGSPYEGKRDARTALGRMVSQQQNGSA
jgi:hypothetical protein